MKNLIVLFAVVASVSAQTNGIDLGYKPATFTNLEGKPFNSMLLVRADDQGIVFKLKDGLGGGRISYTNIHPDFLVLWGIPTNRIGTALKIAKDAAAATALERKSENEKYQQSSVAAAKQFKDDAYKAGYKSGNSEGKSDAQSYYAEIPPKGILDNLAKSHLEGLWFKNGHFVKQSNKFAKAAKDVQEQYLKGFKDGYRDGYNDMKKPAF